jgi:hypothetical protein
MKILELFTEAISYTSKIPTIKKSIMDGILDAIHFLKEDRYLDVKERVNRQVNLTILKAKVGPNLFTHLEHFISEKLTKLASDEILPPDLKASVPVKFKDTGEDLGLAYSSEIDLTEMFIDNLVTDLLDLLHEKTSDNLYSEDSIFEDFFLTAKKLTIQDIVDYSSRRSGINSTVNKIASTLVHEMVHVRQHLPQLQKGRDDTEYRSYLDKTKGEFVQMHGKGYASLSPDERKRYNTLYRSSPQEITAFSHQAAWDVIRDYNLEDIRDISEIPDNKVIFGYIYEYATQYYKKPENPAEQKVYQRYIKLIYQEVDRYLDNLRAQLSKQ